ncbi:MAG TPA: DUF1697 domain-containing protein [Solirubrobacterales bacterium]|jgi:uncharacterized protein (DUF1697 family)|nr:DUF1697 domain-containing protein [Solirubrobacterales bacterium]
MDRYVAFLRGMNLGGRRIKNEELRSHFEALGCDEVATFRASGNVIFEAAGEKRDALASRLEAGLGESLGYEVPVFLRSGEELLAIAAAEPFGAEVVERSEGKLQIALLEDAPSAAARKEAEALSTDADRLAIEGRELYWLPCGRMSDSELDLNAIGAILGPTTIRTKGTVDQIAAKHFVD